jgi:hypothetical protein
LPKRDLATNRFCEQRLFRLLSLSELAHAPTFFSARLPVELPVASLKERWELLPELVLAEAPLLEPASSPVLLPELDALVIFPEWDAAISPDSPRVILPEWDVAISPD